MAHNHNLCEPDWPHCDICNEPQSTEWGEENDWNGETGCHQTCEYWKKNS